MITGQHPFLLILFLIFAATAAIQLFYYFYFYLSPVLYKPKKNMPYHGPVSVIICARNEEQNLREFLPAVLEQKYPDFEVIVVNDCSDDNSFDVLGDFIKKYPVLKVSNISKDPKFTHSKKFAQFIGIKAARNEFLLFIDADCRPAGQKWIKTMAADFSAKIDFVLGYGGYISKKGILNRYIRYDSAFIAIQYFGMAIRGIPYMGVGRNLAYRRSVFFEKKGFGNHSYLASGDDDLFVNSNATWNNVEVEFREEAHTRSVPASSFKELFKQKRRHFSTAVHYKTRDKLLLSVEPLTRLLFYILFPVLICNHYLLIPLITLFILRMTVMETVLILGQKKLNEAGLKIWTIIFDIFSPLVNAVFFTASIRSNPKNSRWN
jgi:cellulose synthase/poly-beta-1,6-N-acetylglucosamine synthase-like glycosyltransferase